MTIIYISNRLNINKTEAHSWLSAFCEITELHLFTDFEVAKEFLSTTVITPQKHVDFIITDWRVRLQNAVVFLDWIRNSDNSYSSSNFQFRSVPIILIEDPNILNSETSFGFNCTIGDFPSNLVKLKNGVKSTIKDWRYNLACDLDLIGLDPKTLSLYDDRKAFISYYRLKILTRHFVDNKSNGLNYIWTTSNFSTLNNANDLFNYKIYKSNTSPSKYMEKEIHEFLKDNKTFLLGEGYSKFVYEPHLYKNYSRSYDEPDFINKPHEYALRMPEVFEVKRSTQRLFRKNNETFLSRAKSSFEQVKRYKQYLKSDELQNQYYIKKYLGEIYPDYEYTLLMGSKTEKDAYLDLIERLKNDFEFSDINLVSYEELLDKHVRMCDRLNEFNIYT